MTLEVMHILTGDGKEYIFGIPSKYIKLLDERQH